MTNMLKSLRSILILSLILLSAFALSSCQARPDDDTRPIQVTGAGDADSVRFAQVSGDVKFVKVNEVEWIPAVQGMGLALQDTLATGAISEADLDVDDNKHVLVGDQVRMVVTQLLKEVGASKAATLKVDNGAVYIRIQKKLGQGESFEVVTPTCIMGVRGTHFVVDVMGGNTVVSVLEGQVTGNVIPTKMKATDTMTKGVAISIKAGEQVRIPMGVRTETDVTRTTLTPEKLPSFVLETIKTENDGLPDTYKNPLDQVIQQVKEAEKSKKIGSGERYMDPVSGHVYARYDDAMDFESAKAFCEAQGGYLMTINGSDEQSIAERLIAQGGKGFYLTGLDQRQESSEPMGGFICEWDSIESVLMPVNSNAMQPGDMSYDFFVTLNLGDDIKKAVDFLGEGKVTESSGVKTHVWTNGDKLLAIKENAGSITATVQKNLASAIVENDLANVQVRGNLIGCKTLQEVESLLSKEGIITGKLLMNGKEHVITRQWVDKKGTTYVATFNESSGKLDHSFSR